MLSGRQRHDVGAQDAQTCVMRTASFARQVPVHAAIPSVCLDSLERPRHVFKGGVPETVKHAQSNRKTLAKSASLVVFRPALLPRLVCLSVYMLGTSIVLNNAGLRL